MFGFILSAIVDVLGVTFLIILVKSYFDFKTKTLISWTHSVPFAGIKVNVEGQKNKSLQLKVEKA